MFHVETWGCEMTRYLADDVTHELHECATCDTIHIEVSLHSLVDSKSRIFRTAERLKGVIDITLMMRTRPALCPLHTPVNHG